MFVLMSFHLHPLSVLQQALILSVCLSICLYPYLLSFCRFSRLSIPIICINQSDVRWAEEPHAALCGRLVVASLYRHYQRTTSSPVLSTALDLWLSIFSSQPRATCAKVLTVEV